MAGQCEVVWADCHQSEGATRAECFACGLPACPDCSVRMRYLRFGTRRIGFDCVEQGMPFTGPGDREKGRAFVRKVLEAREAARQRKADRLRRDRHPEKGKRS